jgi:hypothetical protein
MADERRARLASRLEAPVHLAEIMKEDEPREPFDPLVSETFRPRETRQSSANPGQSKQAHENGGDVTTMPDERLLQAGCGALAELAPGRPTVVRSNEDSLHY